MPVRVTCPLALAIALLAGVACADSAPGSKGSIPRTATTKPGNGKKLPSLVAHRGLLRHAPENTLANFAACIDLRVGFELDIRRSKDGKLVCVHDTTLDRTTNGKGPVASKTLAELRKLDAGGWFDVAFAGQTVPTIEEIFALLKARGITSIWIALDFKVDDDEVEGEVVALAQKYGLVGQIVCIGRTIEVPAVRRRLRNADAKIGVAVLAQTAADLPAALRDKNASWVYVRFVPTSTQVASIHAQGKRVFIAGPTVAGKEPANWQRVRDAGVDAILTDYPLPCRQSWREAAGN